ncbi:MAG: tetratricopeptide repeat protein [Crocinitomicaceae bacterium]|nr:tetratricopeptide repeat protein [Crocinitomicaceae bacterium]
MNYFQRSLAIKNTNRGDKQGEAISYTQLGLIYYDEGNYKEALKYYKKGTNSQS